MKSDCENNYKNNRFILYNIFYIYANASNTENKSLSFTKGGVSILGWT